MRGFLPARLVITASVVITLCFTACINPKNLPGIKQEIIRREGRETKETEEAIKNSPLLQKLDYLCRTEIPLHESFVPGMKDKSFRKGTDYLRFGYYSKASYQAVKDHYKYHLARQGWQLTAQEDGGRQKYIIFRKGEYKFEVYHGGMEVNYLLLCEKLSTSDASE